MKKKLLFIVFLTFMFFCGISSNVSEKWNIVKTENCDVNVYIKCSNDNIDFLIKTSEPIQCILYDVLGKKLLDKEIKKEEIISKKLSKGIYLIRIIDEKTTHVEKIII